jgi:hypothetical protein
LRPRDRRREPDPSTFRLAVQRAGIPASEILFCAESALDELVAQGVDALFPIVGP